jgi:hypothetical protein
MVRLDIKMLVGCPGRRVVRARGGVFVNETMLSLLRGKKGWQAEELRGVISKAAMAELDHFRRPARVPNWSGVAQQPDAHSVLRQFGIAGNSATMPSSIFPSRWAGSRLFWAANRCHSREETFLGRTLACISFYWNVELTRPERVSLFVALAILGLFFAPILDVV